MVGSGGHARVENRRQVADAHLLVRGQSVEELDARGIPQALAEYQEVRKILPLEFGFNLIHFFLMNDRSLTNVQIYIFHLYKHSFRFAQGTKRNENRCAFGVYYCILPL